MPLTVAQLVARLTADTSNFYRGMALANSAMLRSGGLITRVAAGAGLATLGMGIMSLRAAGNYEQSMNILEAVSGATGGQMNKLGKQAIALGADFKLPNVSAKDAAEAMTELAKGGLSVHQVMGATRGTLQLGLAANMGFADSANIVARALTAFHLTGTKATQVADLFTAAANKSTAEMSDIALGFQAASAQFAAGDQTISGLTTSLTLMANAGIVGSDAGTSLKTMMNRLMAPTKKAKDLMGSLGISVYDAHGNMRPMPQLIGQLNKGMGGMSKEARNAALYTIFGSDAIRAARVQMNAGTDGWNKMEKAITHGGEAQKYAEARTKGFNGAMQAFGSAIETLAITLGTHLLPLATRIVKAMANFVSTFDPDPIINFFSAISGGVKWVYNLIKGSDLLQSVLGGLIAGFVAYRTVVGTIAAVTKIWSIAQGILNGVIEANPIVLIISALVALGVGLYIAYKRSEEFRNIVQQVFAAVRAAAAWVQDAARIVWTAMQQMWNTVRPIVQAFVNYITSSWNTIRSLARAVWPAISAVVLAAWNVLKAGVMAAVNVTRAIITSAWNVIRAITTSVWNVIRTIVTSVLDVIHGKISAMQALKNIVSAIWTAIKTVTSAEWNAVKSIVSTAIEGIKGILSAAAGAAGALASGIGHAIISGVLNGVSGLGAALKSKVEGLLSSALSNLNPFSTVEEGGKKHIGEPLARGAIQGWLDGSRDLPSKISDTLRNALEAGKARVDAARTRLGDAFSRLSDYAMNAFDAMTQQHLGPKGQLLAGLVSEHDKAELQGRLDDANRAVSDAQQKLSEVGQAEYDSEKEKNDAIKAAQQDLTDATKQQTDAQYQIRIAALQKEADEETKQYEAQRALQKQHLEDRLAQLEAALMKEPERHDFYQKKILALLNSYGIDYESAGAALGRAFAKGLREAEIGVNKAATNVASAVSRVLRMESPAEEGPLSDLDRWWRSFAPTLLKGVDTGSIREALVGAVAPTGLGVGARSGAAALGASTGAMGGVTVLMQNPQFLTSERETARALYNLIEPFQREGKIQVRTA